MYFIKLWIWSSTLIKITSICPQKKATTWTRVPAFTKKSRTKFSQCALNVTVIYRMRINMCMYDTQLIFDWQSFSFSFHRTQKEAPLNFETHLNHLLVMIRFVYCMRSFVYFVWGFWVWHVWFIVIELWKLDRIMICLWLICDANLNREYEDREIKLKFSDSKGSETVQINNQGVWN